MAGRKPRNTLVIVIGLLLVPGAAILLLMATGQGSASLVPMRILAFAAYLLAFLTILGVLYTRELVTYFGRSFIAVHHIVAVTALALMVLHPLATLVGGYPASYLLPDFSSLRSFLARSGPIALLLFAAAALAALLKASLQKSWRELHWMVYLGFFTASVHGALLGLNLQSILARIIVALLALAVVVIYIRKRQPRRPRANS